MPDIYSDGSYWRSNTTFHSEDAEFKVENCLRLLLKNAKPSKEWKVIDIGCGAGKFLHALSKQLAGDFTGVDVSEVAVAEANIKHARKNVRYLRTNLADVTPTYDLLTMNDVFEHVDDYLGFLRESARLSSLFYFNIPLDMTAWEVLRHGYMRERATLGHIHYFSKRSALATLEYAGFEIIEAEYNHTTLLQMKKKPTIRGIIAAAPRLLTFKLAPDLSVHLLGGASLSVLCRPKTDH